MSKKHQFQNENDEHGEKLDPFHEMLQVLDVENLLRFRKRLEKVGRKRMVQILSEEIAERDHQAKAEAKAEAEAIDQERRERKDKEKEKVKAEKPSKN
jgi:hypothetical protein